MHEYNITDCFYNVCGFLKMSNWSVFHMAETVSRDARTPGVTNICGQKLNQAFFGTIVLCCISNGKIPVQYFEINIFILHPLLIPWIFRVMFRQVVWGLPSEVLCILEAVLTVSPNKQYLGIFSPTTPAATGPTYRMFILMI